MSIAVSLLIVIVIVIIYVETARAEESLYGFWTAADDDFCESAEINSMLVFIGEGSGVLMRQRECYIVITDDIASESFTLTYARPVIVGERFTVECSAAFTGTNLFSESDDQTQSSVSLTVDRAAGKLRISRGDKVYASLTKQNDVTNLAREAD